MFDTIPSMKLGLGEAASGEDLGNRLIDLFQARDRLDLEIAVTAAAFAQTDEYDEQGSVSPIDWIRHNCHTTAGAAGRNPRAVAEHVDGWHLLAKRRPGLGRRRRPADGS